MKSVESRKARKRGLKVRLPTPPPDPRTLPEYKSHPHTKQNHLQKQEKTVPNEKVKTQQTEKPSQEKSQNEKNTYEKSQNEKLYEKREKHGYETKPAIKSTSDMRTPELTNKPRPLFKQQESKVDPKEQIKTKPHIDIQDTKLSSHDLKSPVDLKTHDFKTPEESPTVKELKDKDMEFIEYLENLQKCNPGLARSTSLFAPTIVAEDAFDHLERLYKLMEQMLVLREQNSKLHRRIRDLEHFRNVQSLQKNLEQAECGPDFDKESAFAESLLNTILLGAKNSKPSKFSASSRLRHSILRRQRHRGGSVSMGDKTSDYDLSGTDRRSSVITPNSDKSAKVSKWTKVKEAFKWEKAASQVVGWKTPESDSGLVPVNYEVTRYLRVPSTSEDFGSSPVDSGAAGISTPGTISSASSMEDLQYVSRKGDYSSEDEQYYIPDKGEQKKGPRTRWARMKDMIQPRSSLKKRHRLSGRSDDYKIEDSDNEDVFLADPPASPSPSKAKLEKSRSFPEKSSRVPPEIVERYQNLVAEDMLNFADPDLKVSRWTRVKKAFLPSGGKADEDENANTEAPCCLQDSCKPAEKKLHAEIEENYQELRKKLSLEFHDKIVEWEKNKLNSPGHASCSGPSLPSDDAKEQAFIKKIEEWEKIKATPKLAMTSEENLDPEFRKKLEEWKKKKFSKDEPVPSTSKKKIGELPKCKSVGAYKFENSPIDQKPLSQDFLKKLETWKQIKSGAIPYPDDDSKRTTDGKSPSPRMSRKDSSTRSSKKVKEQTDKELQWFEKELVKIEREKQRLERERQKFLEREERLSKFRKAVIGNNKKEVFVHTPTGFYRFEGISRKFTQKLWEWEKAQGIGPEASTFALLTSSFNPDVQATLQTKRDSKASTLFRSKSADSIANSMQNLVCPILSEQPSSLSLNDVENLESNRMLDSRLSSMRDVIPSSENIASDEPEALIVEVEDVYEETAAPLLTFFDKEETPVYQQQQENQILCESKKNSGPKVRRSESTKAQINYNLIEDTMNILKRLTEIEKDVEDVENGIFANTSQGSAQENYSLFLQTKNLNLKDSYEAQAISAKILIEKVALLQQENTNVTTNISNEGSNTSHLSDILDSIQDLSSEVIQLGEKLRIELATRHKNGPQDDSTNYTRANYPNISSSLRLLHLKLLDIRRKITYICAASDLTAPGKKRKYQKRGILRRKSSEENESKKYHRNTSPSNVEDSSSSMDNAPIPVGQGAVRKRIKYRQKDPSFYKAVHESDENEDNFRDLRKVKQKRFSKSRSASENTSQEVVEKNSNGNNEIQDILVDPTIVQKVVVPTKTTNYVSSNVQGEDDVEQCDTPVTIFVKTTRKLFTPIASLGESEDVPKDINNEDLSKESGIETGKTSSNDSAKNSPKLSRDNTITEESDKNNKALASQLPPLPPSPSIQRKVTKEISPSIRIMMVKYNQKVSEQEACGHRSAGSSGSGSPTAWRSPVLERRVRAQTEKYQEEINKLSPLLGRREVQKSASVGLLYSGRKQVTVHGKPEETSPEVSPKCTRGILKSTSINTISNDLETTQNLNSYVLEGKCNLKLSIPAQPIEYEERVDERKLRLRKAREEFLNSPATTPVSAPTPLINSPHIEYPKSRLSQVSVGSESSYDSGAGEGWLVKSASAGMINIDPDVYKQFDPAFHQDGYVSLPRSNRGKGKEGFLSNITSKFRKVKMRRAKDPSKMNTISKLCRQSLIVDIGSDSQENIQGSQKLSSDSSKPSTSDSSKDYLNVPSDCNRGSSSDDISTGESSRSGRWLPRPRIFKPKQ